MSTNAIAGDLSVDSVRGGSWPAVVNWIAGGRNLVAERAAQYRVSIDRLVGAAVIVCWFARRRHWAVVQYYCRV